MYVFMDADYNQFEVEAEMMGDALHYLEDGMTCEVVFYNDKAISVELPTTLVREIIYTEPAVKGDTSSGKVLKTAKLTTGFELQCRCSATSATRSKSTRVRTSTAAARKRLQPESRAGAMPALRKMAKKSAQFGRFFFLVAPCMFTENFTGNLSKLPTRGSYRPVFHPTNH